MYIVNKSTLNAHFIISIRRALDNISMKRALWFSQLVQYDIQTDKKPLAIKSIQKRHPEDNTSNVEPPGIYSHCGEIFPWRHRTSSLSCPVVIQTVRKLYPSPEV